MIEKIKVLLELFTAKNSFSIIIYKHRICIGLIKKEAGISTMERFIVNNSVPLKIVKKTEETKILINDWVILPESNYFPV